MSRFVQVHWSEESCNRSPWENDHKSQLVKPILIKTYRVGTGTGDYTSVRNFRHIGSLISRILQKQYQAFLQKKLENQGFLFRELPSIVFIKGLHWIAPFEEIYISIQLDMKDSKFLKIRVSLTNPRSSSSGTRMDTSNQ